MDWVLRRRTQLVRIGVGVGAVLTLANLALGPERFSLRVVTVLVNVLVVPFAYFGVRSIIALQVKLHGMSDFVKQGCSLLFYFFGLASVASTTMVILQMGRHTPWAVTFWGAASFSLGALDSYARGKHHEGTNELAT